MNIITAFEDEFLVSRYRKGAALIFRICWEHEGVFYPERAWDDFGAVILVWWLDATRKLRAGAAGVTYRFMDGPYGIQAHFARETGTVTLQPEDEDYVWTTTIDDLIAALDSAAQTVRDKLVELGIGEQDRLSLEFVLERLA